MADKSISSILVGLGQTLAILLFLLCDERDAFQRHPYRIGLTVCFLFLQSAIQGFTHFYVSDNGWGNLPSLEFLAITWLLYVLFIYLWSRVSWSTCCFIAFLLLLVDACIWPLIITASRLFWAKNYLYEGNLFIRIPFLLLFALLECSLALLAKRLLPDIRKIQLNTPSGILAIGIVIPFLFFRWLFAQNTSQDNKLLQILLTMCSLVSAITLAAEVGYSSNEHEKMREAQMQQILQSQKELFEQKLKNVDQVNRKYHDMKNTLLYLRSHSDQESVSSSIEDLLESIEPYSKMISTGNEVMDVILHEKLTLCEEKKITCIPYLDGTLFRFVKPLDLCTLIGNAMDNAIESCEVIPRPENRCIRLYTASKGEAVVLEVRNTFFHRPVLGHGMPATTKADRLSHGYGLQNMQAIAESYDGSLNCRIDGEEFVLTILLSRTQRA